MAELSIRSSAETRPEISRSRSNTDPNGRFSPVGDSTTASRPTRRPQHIRSHSSTVITIETKPRTTQTLPQEKSSRLHIPGKGSNRNADGDTGRRHHLRHRHSQSENHASRPGRGKQKKGDEMSHLVAGLNAERRHNLSRMPSNSDAWQNRMNDLVRISSGPMKAGGHSDGQSPTSGKPAAYNARTTVTHEPNPTQKKTMTELEMLLDRSAIKRAQARQTVGRADVEKLQAQLDEARQELQDRLLDVSQVTGDVTRRLEYTYYSLLEKLGRLVNIISSFQSLREQSSKLLVNFESEVGRLDGEIRRRVGAFDQGFDNRETKVRDLEERGIRAGAKARELGIRLENARIVVFNWEKREAAAKKKLWRVYGSIWWSSVILVSALMLMLVWKEWWLRGDPVAAGLGVPRGGNRDRSLSVNNKVLGEAEVPPDVRAVLEGIQDRRMARSTSLNVSQPVSDQSRQDDDRLRVLDEL